MLRRAGAVVLQAGERVDIAEQSGHYCNSRMWTTQKLIDVRVILHCRAGAVVLQAGERVGVAEVGTLATVGAASLPEDKID